MAEHYPRNTVSAESWCGKCRRHTQHRVDEGRIGPCLNCVKRLEDDYDAREPAKPAAEQRSLFAR